MTRKIGIDLGSTTAKLVVLDENNELLFSRYRRHNTEIVATLTALVNEAIEELGDIACYTQVTGSAGMGISERTGISFIQEVVSSAEVVRKLYRSVHTLIDLGGEDAKIIFFNQDMKPDIRMNGNCAGGTGAFIDQMATLLHVSIDELDKAAQKSTTIYPIASRCGVFAKTDIQNLISRHIPLEDIAASIFRAVAFQTINALARGMDIQKKLIFSGGPLKFQKSLRDAFLSLLEIGSEELVDLEHPELLPAIGAAFSVAEETPLKLSQLAESIAHGKSGSLTVTDRLEPLFTSEDEVKTWLTSKEQYQVPVTTLEKLDGKGAYIGVDSGSTTTKAVLVSEEGEIAATYYSNNKGKPVETLMEGLQSIYSEIKEKGLNIEVKRCAVTGYGEDLIRFAFQMDDGVVETIAHYKAAQMFESKVSFILDIGGQDMKAIFIRDGIIDNLEINEACSSGSGSFIEGFARSLNMSAADFGREACSSQAPCDLGTRCTVFMNSKVKQSLREGASIADISAGLSYSVLKNCFNKVLKLTDYDALGEYVVAQGGTFKNPAILKAMEKVTGKTVIRPDRSELMGAWGAALTAKERYSQKGEESLFIGWEHLGSVLQYERKNIVCKGCENLCNVSRITYNRGSGKHHFFTGNKCEAYFTNQIEETVKAENLFDIKRALLFDRPTEPTGKPIMTIGIPRVLNLWEDYPFWATLLVESGFSVKLSSPSTMNLADKGCGTVMSENICFPAKITNGHIMDLIEQKVDRIFYPMVRYTRRENDKSHNEYNCPIVTGYPSVIASAINPEKNYNIPYDNIEFTLNEDSLLKEKSRQYLASLGVKEDTFEKAYKKALTEQHLWKETLQREAERIVTRSKEENRLLLVAIGRPYHVDPLINHKIPEMISTLGVDLITEDSIPYVPEESFNKDINTVTQWSFPNRIYSAAIWAGERENTEVIQLNSFGCGPDAVSIDEVKVILNQYMKMPTLVRIDEMSTPGSIKLRIRSLIESLKIRGTRERLEKRVRERTKPFTEKDKHKKILAPLFAPFYTNSLVAAFKHAGYDLEVLPMPDRESVETGLKYANNDICYPATIVIGDLIKALQSGKYDLDNVAVGLSQTGGQCRASSYISLLKKGMINAGFKDIPVIAVSTTSGLNNPINDQPGFNLGKVNFSLNVFLGFLFGDVLAKLYYYTVPREKVAGTCDKLMETYLKLSEDKIDYKNTRDLFRVMKEMVKAFNQVEIDDVKLPKVGIVGEIYVKYNNFGNGYIIDHLIANGIEPDVPPIVNFFLKPLVTQHFNREKLIIQMSHKQRAGLYASKKITEFYVKKANKILALAKGDISPIPPIELIAEKAEPIINLINQFGESWLLPGDIGLFAEEGVNDVVCLQPFGCIANHVIAKGVEKRMKEIHPHLNLLFLDMDPGASEVNTANRLEFLIRGAKEGIESRVVKNREAG